MPAHLMGVAIIEFHACTGVWTNTTCSLRNEWKAGKSQQERHKCVGTGHLIFDFALPAQPNSDKEQSVQLAMLKNK